MNWRRLLEREHGRTEAARLAGEIRARQAALAREIPVPEGRILRARRVNLLLPGLALYQVLKGEIGRERALAETDRLFRTAFFRAEQAGIPVLNRLLPDPFPLVRFIMKQSAVSGYAPGEVEWVEDSRDCLAFNVRRCYLFDTLTALGAPELTVLYCNTDDWLAELMPRVGWERTQTLGRGGPCCDFCWRRFY